MTITITVRPEELYEFAQQRKRPITMKEAEYGLARAASEMERKVLDLRRAWMSKALDNARAVTLKRK